MFQFRGFPPYSYGFTIRWYGIAVPGFPIRKSADQWIFAPTRSLSQLVTSFFGSWCQVILPTLFIAWPFVNLLLNVRLITSVLELFKNQRFSIFIEVFYPFWKNLSTFYLYRVCKYFHTFLKSSLSSFALFSFQGTIYILLVFSNCMYYLIWFYKSSSIDFACISDFFDVAAYVYTQDREKIS